MISNIKKNLITYLVLLIVVVYIIVKLIYYYDPFDPIVWGSVSDWFMVIVTIITAIYLIKTFSSGQEINRIEQDKFRLQFLPKLSAKINHNTITVLVENNPLVKMMTFQQPKNRYDYVNLWHHYGDHNALEELIPGKDFLVAVNRGDDRLKTATGIHDEVYLFFLDSQNNLYQQTISYNWNNTVVILKSPKHIKNVIDDSEFTQIVNAIAKKHNLKPNMFTQMPTVYSL